MLQLRILLNFVIAIGLRFKIPVVVCFICHSVFGLILHSFSSKLVFSLGVCACLCLCVFWGLLHVYRPDTQRIFVDIGLGFHVEFTWSEALKFISLREEKLERYAFFLKWIKLLCWEVLYVSYLLIPLCMMVLLNLFVSVQFIEMLSIVHSL